jgi:transcription antitermination factor NusG
MNLRWFVIRSKPHKEDLLTEQMQLRQLEIFHPCIRVQTVNPRARKVKPYFPGYVFAHFDLEKTGRSSMQFIPGAASLVTFGGEPADVPDGLIQAIRRRVDEINAAGGELFETLKRGEPIRIHSGPFEGYEGIFDVRLPGTDRARVLLRLLKDRQMRVELPAGSIRVKK